MASSHSPFLVFLVLTQLSSLVFKVSVYFTRMLLFSLKLNVLILYRDLPTRLQGTLPFRMHGAVMKIDADVLCARQKWTHGQRSMETSSRLSQLKERCELVCTVSFIAKMKALLICLFCVNTCLAL